MCSSLAISIGAMIYFADSCAMSRDCGNQVMNKGATELGQDPSTVNTRTKGCWICGNARPRVTIPIPPSPPFEPLIHTLVFPACYPYMGDM